MAFSSHLELREPSSIWGCRHAQASFRKQEPVCCCTIWGFGSIIYKIKFGPEMTRDSLGCPLVGT